MGKNIESSSVLATNTESVIYYNLIKEGLEQERRAWYCAHKFPATVRNTQNIHLKGTEDLL